MTINQTARLKYDVFPWPIIKRINPFNLVAIYHGVNSFQNRAFDIYTQHLTVSVFTEILFETCAVTFLIKSNFFRNLSCLSNKLRIVYLKVFRVSKTECFNDLVPTRWLFFKVIWIIRWWIRSNKTKNVFI